MGNFLRKFITHQEFDDIVDEAMRLESDMQFFKLYIERNKKSKFSIPINISYGCVKQFFQLVDNGDYSYQKLFKTLSEYKIISKFVEQASNECFIYSDEEMKLIYQYFMQEYEILLEDIISEFSGSSVITSKVLKKIDAIRNSYNNN